MAKLNWNGIRENAKSLIALHPGGIRYSELVKAILQEAPETPKNTVAGGIRNLDALFPFDISKPSRGLYKPANVATDGPLVVADAEEVTPAGLKVKESEFYEPFAQWLKNDLDEVTEASPLGGAGIKSKWGTPDVIGVYKPTAGNLIKFPMEIVSAEIKIDPKQPIVAFGQAVAYRLFCSKVYVVMPTTMTEEDQSKLESLCILFGIGFVLFDMNTNDPRFSIRVRAQRFSPDMFYVNEFADRLRQCDGDVFEKLFR